MSCHCLIVHFSGNYGNRKREKRVDLDDVIVEQSRGLTSAHTKSPLCFCLKLQSSMPNDLALLISLLDKAN